MDLGYQGKLFLLAFDHRDSFKDRMFGIAGRARAAAVPGHAGFAIGRTMWWDAVATWRGGSPGRPEAAAATGDGHRWFMDVYQRAAAGPSPA